jgi:hypothetical protein
MGVGCVAGQVGPANSSAPADIAVRRHTSTPRRVRHERVHRHVLTAAGAAR